MTDVEWFLLVDEPTRNGRSKDGATYLGGGWQSGLMTAGGPETSTPKLAYTQDAALFAQGRAACTGAPISWTPAGGIGSTPTTTTGATPGGKGSPKGPKPKKKP